MNRNKLLSVLLLLWVVLAVGGSVYRIYSLGLLISNSGPQALAADGQGGFYLATNDELLHFGSNEKLLERKSAADLGLQNIKALTQGNDHTLWVYDAAPHRPFRCDENNWACSPFGPDKLGLDTNVSLALGPAPANHLIISDDTNQRLVVLDSQGQLLDDGHGKTWHFPNQISTTAGGLLLANTDRFEITRLDAAQPNGDDKPVLQTTSRPYRFVQRGNDWWVVEAGVSLENGWVRHYHGTATSPAQVEAPDIVQEAMKGAAPAASSELLSLKFRDIVAIADTGSQIIIASKSDWGLLVLDPATDIEHEINDDSIRSEFYDRSLTHTAAVAERGRLPLVMILLIMPALVLGVLLQKRMDAARTAALLADAANMKPPFVPGAGFASSRKTSSMQVIITPNMESLEKIKAKQKWAFILLGIVTGLFVCVFVIAMISMAKTIPHKHMGDPVFLAIGPILAMLLLVPAMLYAQWQRWTMAFSQSLDCGRTTLTLNRKNNPFKITEYSKVWLCDTTLIMGDLCLPRFIPLKDIKTGKLIKHEIWPTADVEQVLQPRLPPHQVFSRKYDLARALWRVQPKQAVALMGQEIATIVILVIVVGLQLSRLHAIHF